MTIGLQILDRVEQVHSKGFVYRDIKPENFLLGDTKGENYLKTKLNSYSKMKRKCTKDTKKDFVFTWSWMLSPKVFIEELILWNEDNAVKTITCVLHGLVVSQRAMMDKNLIVKEMNKIKEEVKFIYINPWLSLALDTYHFLSHMSHM